jgi:hypothetical protein
MSWPEPGFNNNWKEGEHYMSKKMAKIPPGTKNLWEVSLWYESGRTMVKSCKVLHIGTRWIEFMNEHGVICSAAMDEDSFNRRWSTTKVGAFEKALAAIEKRIEEDKHRLEKHVTIATELRETIAELKEEL